VCWIQAAGLCCWLQPHTLSRTVEAFAVAEVCSTTSYCSLQYYLNTCLPACVWVVSLLHLQLLVFSPEQRAAQPFGPAMDPAVYQLLSFLGPYIYR
jgi:hypothetical protein